MGLMSYIRDVIFLELFNIRRIGPIRDLIKTEIRNDCIEGGIRYGYKRGLSMVDVGRLRQEALDYRF